MAGLVFAQTAAASDAVAIGRVVLPQPTIDSDAAAIVAVTSANRLIA
jgi:hypothetical protein